MISITCSPFNHINQIQHIQRTMKRGITPATLVAQQDRSQSRCKTNIVTKNYLKRSQRCLHGSNWAPQITNRSLGPLYWVGTRSGLGLDPQTRSGLAGLDLDPVDWVWARSGLGLGQVETGSGLGLSCSYCLLTRHPGVAPDPTCRQDCLPLPRTDRTRRTRISLT